jgi:hypothetical protein
MKFRKIPVVIDAVQWFEVEDYVEGKKRIVDHYRHPGIPGSAGCISSIPCQHTMHDHGWIDTPEGGHNVCPGDWIITGVDGENYPVKDRIFKKTYEEVK